MPVTKSAVPALPSLVKHEMEDRKRSLLNDGDDLAPSRKRVKDENGVSMRMSDEQKEKDVEDFQKDAIIRQMKEYKRQKKDADDLFAELHKKTKFHDDHLRIIDAWFAQLLDEIRVLAAEMLPTPPPSADSTSGDETYKSALLFEDVESFSEHLKTRSTSIKSAIRDLFGRLPPSTPNVEELRKQMNELLAKEKEHAVELRKTIDEKESLYERLEMAMGRYMTAERKLDRAKSLQVQKLERQAIMGGNGDASSPATSKAAVTPKREHTDMNGDLENGIASAELETARKEALAAADRRKAQLEEIEAENERLTNELSAARTKLASLSDDDYAETSLFKIIKSQYQDVVKRVNDLETINTQLREEAQKLHAERTAYRRDIDEEHRTQTSKIESESARSDNDLTRVRHMRDVFSAEVNILKGRVEDQRTSVEQVKELAEERAMRISVLESEVERLKVQMGEAQATAGDFEAFDMDALQGKCQELESSNVNLKKEIASMEEIWKKNHALTSKKVEDTANWEDQVARLTAEKAKAEQKYFQAMKSRDTQESELRTLKAKNARSSEIVTQLKDVEAKTRELCSNYERQLAESREALAKLEQTHRSMEQRQKDSATSVDGLQKNVDELKTLVRAKDREHHQFGKLKREAEENLDKCKARLDETKRQYDTLKKSRVANSGADSDDWRKVAICPVCNANIRNTVLKLCGHVFCSNCVKDLISNRSRKCPSCGRGFGSNDQMPIVLT